MIGIDFATKIADVDETVLDHDHENPSDYVKRLAIEKCKSINSLFDENYLIIAADTTVYLKNRIYGKPKNNEEAFIFLSKLSSQTHIVFTCVAIAHKRIILSDIAKTSVTFLSLTKDDIYQYIETNEHEDKAGGYGIQGYGSQFIKKINGCYFNVMGFPISLFYNMLKNNLNNKEM